MTIAIKNLNDLSDGEFITLLGGAVENSNWVMERAAKLRPFTSIRGLHQAVSQVLSDASEREQLDLIGAHPDLADKAVPAGDTTDSSVSEQHGVRLDRLSEEEFERFERLNDGYKSKFGFPFIIAVKGHDKTSILQALEKRLENDEDSELAETLCQIGEIIRDRLDGMIIHGD